MKWYFLLILLLLIPLVSADEDVFRIGEAQDLKITIADNDTYNAGSTKCSLTSFYPNNTIFIKNGTMTNQVYFHNYTTTFDTTGVYTYTVCCADGAVKACGAGYFTVTTFGKSLSNAQAFLYVLIFFISLIFFIITLYVGLTAPYKNRRDEMTGYIIAIENYKYLKILSLCFSYLILMLMSYFAWMICYGYLDLEFLGKLFNFLFYGMVYLLLPGFIIGFIIIIINLVRDSKVADALSGGLSIR